MQGTVKWFSSVKGFGFLLPDGGGKDIFVHYSAIRMDGFRELVEGERVEFETEIGKGNKLQAAKVRRVEEPQK
jgi:CspA family cold shock protein